MYNVNWIKYFAFNLISPCFFLPLILLHVVYLKFEMFLTSKPIVRLIVGWKSILILAKKMKSGFDEIVCRTVNNFVFLNYFLSFICAWSLVARAADQG